MQSYSGNIVSTKDLQRLEGQLKTLEKCCNLEAAAQRKFNKWATIGLVISVTLNIVALIVEISKHIS